MKVFRIYKAVFKTTYEEFCTLRSNSWEVNLLPQIKICYQRLGYIEIKISFLIFVGDVIFDLSPSN